MDHMVMDHVNQFINLYQKYSNFKSNFVSTNKVLSISSKRVFDSVVPNGTTYVD